ncbi:MAG: phosphoribosylformylglycinamidine synthase subunit PurQ [Thermodesulfovibrionales bacterium]
MFGVVVFPGSNCDHDCYHVLKHVLRQPTHFIWHQEDSIDPSFKVIVLPGGFSYGDYLRTGAIARFSPVMKAVTRFAQNGGIVIGICNGFQILLEARLLPGAMLRNRGLRFICKDLYLRVDNRNTVFTNQCPPERVLKIPIAHGEGNYFAPPDVLKELKDNNQIVFRYCGPDGTVNDEHNPNGSVENIAGIINKEGNILGMMPHPERASEEILGNTDGLYIFKSIIKAIESHGNISAVQSVGM